MKKFVLAIGLLCSLCHSMELRIIHRGIIDQTINDDSALCATLSGLTAMFLTTTMTYAYCHQRNDNFDQCKNTGILASIPVGLITAGVVCGLKVRQLYERYYPRENYLYARLSIVHDIGKNICSRSCKSFAHALISFTILNGLG